MGPKDYKVPCKVPKIAKKNTNSFHPINFSKNIKLSKKINIPKIIFPNILTPQIVELEGGA